MRRSTYDRVGGWSTLAASRIDDVDMTTLVRDSGVRTQIVDSERTLFTTGMHGFADAWQSLRKNWVAADCDVRALLGQPAASGVLAPFSWAAIGCLVGDAARIVRRGTARWRGR